MHGVRLVSTPPTKTKANAAHGFWESWEVSCEKSTGLEDGSWERYGSRAQTAPLPGKRIRTLKKGLTGAKDVEMSTG
jgi:hypothetical protein